MWWVVLIKRSSTYFRSLLWISKKWFLSNCVIPVLFCFANIQLFGNLKDKRNNFVARWIVWIKAVVFSKKKLQYSSNKKSEISFCHSWNTFSRYWEKLWEITSDMFSQEKKRFADIYFFDNIKGKNVWYAINVNSFLPFLFGLNPKLDFIFLLSNWFK